MRSSRRDFLKRTGAASLSLAALNAVGKESSPSLHSPFRISVINDEISQDFDRSCEVAREFGMQWIELRGMWNKNIVDLDSKEVGEAQRILKKYELRVTDIASPLFKTAWKDDPRAKEKQSRDFNASFTFEQQGEVLGRAIAMAKAFRTDRVRCFDFFRLDEPAPHRDAINKTLLDAANKCGNNGLILVLENDGGLNTATGAEAAKVLAAVQSPHFMLNWDPGNATANGERAYPDGYNLLPKNRIGHCHCKDVKRTDKEDWAAMGKGIIDWAGQFRALKSDGYHFAVSLETHWRGGGTPEASTRESWAGMKKLLQQAGALQVS
ncbi:MAG TPA: sugar phosphate isomerase/epimerase family protein [Terriglobales bacterium]|nr:sugar phosphate isomerase/epimerase family protein [Terriglobales bacterium]